MPVTPIKVTDKLDALTRHWSPGIIARLNDYEVKLAKIQGEFVWHQHDDTDELFYCLSGEMHIEFRDGVIQLQEGELVVVPKGVEHRPRAAQECHILLIEPAGVINTGDAASGPLTAETDRWL